MIRFEKTIGKSEAQNGYLNLTDDKGVTYGKHFPPHRSRLYIITEGEKYKATKVRNNQIWGGLHSWYKRANISSGDRVIITFDPKISQINGRIPIEIIRI